MSKEVDALEGMTKWKECHRMVIVGVVEQAKYNRRRFQTECRMPELFIFRMVMQGPGVDMGWVSKMEYRRSRKRR